MNLNLNVNSNFRKSPVFGSLGMLRKFIALWSPVFLNGWVEGFACGDYCLRDMSK